MPEEIDSSFNTGRYQGNFGGDQGDSYYSGNPEEWRQQPGTDPARSRNVLGAILIIIGLLFLIKEVFNWLDFKVVFPLLLIVIGAMIIYRGRRGNV